MLGRAVPGSSTEVAADVESRLHERLASDAEPVALRSGDYLFRSGDRADRLYVVRTGRLRVLVEDADCPESYGSSGPAPFSASSRS